MYQSSLDVSRNETCDVLLCLICRRTFDDSEHQPKFLPCHHTFCKNCLRQCVERSPTNTIECPSCHHTASVPTAGVSALQTNPYVQHIQKLMHEAARTSNAECCSVDKKQAHSRCAVCHDGHESDYDKSITQETAHNKEHRSSSLTATTEQYRRRLEVAFTRANAAVERKRGEIERALGSYSEDKDHAIMKIESSFEQLTHVLSRRATVLKNAVIEIYNAQVNEMDVQLEDLSTAITCLVSLRDYHETAINKGNMTDVDEGIHDIEYVQNNIEERIIVPQGHIKYDEDHDLDGFRTIVKDIGRAKLVVSPDKMMHHLKKMSASENNSPEGIRKPSNDPNQRQSLTRLSDAVTKKDTSNETNTPPVIFYTTSDSSLPELPVVSSSVPTVTDNADTAASDAFKLHPQDNIPNSDVAEKMTRDYLFINSYSYDETERTHEELSACYGNKPNNKFLSKSAVFDNDDEIDDYDLDEHKYMITDFTGEQTSL